MSKPVVRGPVDGNAFAVMGAVTRALKRAGQGDKVEEYRVKAMSGDYHHLLAVSMEYVDFDLSESREDDQEGDEPDWEDQGEVDEPEHADDY